MNFHQTSRCQLNKSISKQLYSFSKAQRFQKIMPSSCKSSYYDGRVTAIGKRTTSFGYGNKMTFQNRQKVPPPGQYDRYNVFENNLKKRRGFSFSHQNKRNIINQEETVRYPGPGKYNFKHDKINFKNVSFSMRSKVEDPMEKHQNPLGPGQYPILNTINPEGKQYVSKYQSSGASKIGHARRFTDIKTISPGPGKYEDTKVTGLNNSGTYFYSTFKTSKANRFAGSIRKHIAEPTITPGPGTYPFFSEFPQMD